MTEAPEVRKIDQDSGDASRAGDRKAFLPGGVSPAAGLRNPATIHFRDRNPIGTIGDGGLEFYS